MKTPLFLLVPFLLLSSCVSHQELRNFPEVDFPINSPEDIVNQIQIRIQPDDILTISVSSYDPAAAAPFNQRQGGANVQLNANNLNAARLFIGYLVDEDGFIDFPVLGRIKAASKTINELREEILAGLQPYLKDAVVTVKFINFKITILGEVTRPASYNVPNTRMSIFDALGLAGDLTDYANRNNILVIREQNGKREYGRLDLQSQDVFQSPYFYLAQNDVIYVDPLQPRTATVADPLQRFISYVSAGLSIVTLVIALTR